MQTGPVKDVGTNGLTIEVLLAMAHHRLSSFNTGEFRCRENSLALTHIEDALFRLHDRTRQRLARGVEGTMIP